MTGYERLLRALAPGIGALALIGLWQLAFLSKAVNLLLLLPSPAEPSAR